VRADPLVLALAPLGDDWQEPGSPALRARLEQVRACFYDLTRSNLGGGGLSLLPFIDRWRKEIS
jgi:hypothetical protein